jgi:hypothetical protein
MTWKKAEEKRTTSPGKTAIGFALVSEKKVVLVFGLETPVRAMATFVP